MSGIQGEAGMLGLKMAYLRLGQCWRLNTAREGLERPRMHLSAPEVQLPAGANGDLPKTRC